MTRSAQPTLLDPDPEGADSALAARPRRVTAKGIAPGDIVEVDKKGRRFHALVTSLEQGESGRFELELRPLDRRITWRAATVREVVAVWRRARSV